MTYQVLVEYTMLAWEVVADTSSHLSAAVRGWAYPASRETLTLMAIADRLDRLWATTVQAATGGETTPEWDPYPRPWDDDTKPEPEQLPADIAAILTAIGAP